MTFPGFRSKFKHVLRISFESLTTAILITGAILYGLSNTFKSVPLASVGVVVIFSVLA
jgi:hypothetical protein